MQRVIGRLVTTRTISITAPCVHALIITIRALWKNMSPFFFFVYFVFSPRRVPRFPPVARDVCSPSVVPLDPDTRVPVSRTVPRPFGRDRLVQRYPLRHRYVF